jgi:hypothetical protein
MRWFFVLLVLANIFFGLWQLQARSHSPIYQGGVSAALVPTLVMVGEADRYSVEPRELEVPLQQESRPDLVESSCWFVSGFDEKKAADEAVAAIQSAQFEAHVETLEVDDRSDYWVHVGPFVSRDRALAVLLDLRGKNIDSFLIGDGELKNGISLGLFSQKSSAERLAKRHKAIGYPLRVFEVKRVKPSYQLYASGRVEKSDLVALMKDYGLVVNPAKKSKKSCI